MKLHGSRYILENKRAWIAVGYNFNRVCIGFSVTRYGIDIDLLFFWFSVEL